MEEQVRRCVRCGRPVIREAERFEVFEQMHWTCFHYEFEHQAAGSADDDPDIACKDPVCPARALDPEPQPDWSSTG
jgi:ferredoxin